MKQSVLEVENLNIGFQMYHKGTKRHTLSVITDLSVQVLPGEIHAVVGSSGSGKSLLAHAVLGILPQNAEIEGSMSFCGEALTQTRKEQLRGKEMALIPQSVTYLDPLMRVKKQVWGAGKKKVLQPRQKSIFQRLGLPQQAENQLPGELSGGMARRVLFSTAMMTDAKLILADEPTPGMELSQALEALKTLRELAETGKGVLLITHDLDLAKETADRISVFYAGTTLETALASEFHTGEALRHPYSKALWAAMPQNGFQPLPGTQPAQENLPEGCLFAPRCAMCTAECLRGRPPTRALRGGSVRCVHGT